MRKGLDVGEWGNFGGRGALPRVLFEELRAFRGRGSTISNISETRRRNQRRREARTIEPSGLVNAWPVFCVPRKRRNEVRNDRQQWSTQKNYVVTTSFVWIVFILSRSAHLYNKVTPHSAIVLYRYAAIFNHTEPPVPHYNPPNPSSAGQTTHLRADQ